MSSGEKVITPKFLEYQYIETVLLRLDAYYSQGGTLNTNARAYFDPNSIIPGRRVIAIEIISNKTNFTYEGVSIAPIASLGRFTITIVDRQANEVVKDFVVFDLHRSNTFGNIRVFNLIPNIEKCYVLNTGIPIVLTNQGLLFNFYTVDW